MSFSFQCKEFASVCERSTDFHFPSFEHQLSSIEDCLQQANQARSTASASLDSHSVTSKHSDSSLEVSENRSVKSLETKEYS